MNESTEKYLAQMLEGYEQNLGPVNAALDQLENQKKGLTEQRDAMIEGIAELKVLLGIEEEDEEPKLQLVTDDE